MASGGVHMTTDQSQNRIGNDTHKHTVFILHVYNESEAYFVALLASKSREKHRLTYRPFDFLKHAPTASWRAS